MKRKQEGQNKENRYLLILPCSKKKGDAAAAPAIELYNGPFYQVLRKHRLPNLDVLILSAKYGLIKADDVISPYDQRITRERVAELSKAVNNKLQGIIRTTCYEGIMVNLGSTYMAVLNSTKDELDRLGATYAHGMIGERIKQLKEWLTDVLAE